MKKNLRYRVVLFFSSLFLSGVCLFPHQSLAYVFSGFDTSLDLESPHYIKECGIPEGGEVEYTFDPPNSYTSNQVEIETSSSIFELKIDVCNGQSTCLVPLTPGKRLSFKVKFSIRADNFGPPAGFRQTNCITYIGVYRASSSSSTPLPSPTIYQKISPSPVPTQTLPSISPRFSPLVTAGQLKPTGQQKEICGNNNCESWAGEDCQNCPQDCNVVPGFCCAPFKNYINPASYRNKIYDDRKPEANLIPEGMLVFPYDFTSERYFATSDFQICSQGKIVNGSCSHNGHCPKGFCQEGKVNKCINLDTYPQGEYSVAAVKQEAAKIREAQTNYKIAYIETYKKIENQITSKREVAGLEIKLEVQGQTVGKIPEVTVGKTTEVRMYIKNITDHDIMVTSDIFYEKEKGQEFKVISENKTTVSFAYLDEKWLNFGSMWGSFKSRLVGFNYFIMPKGSSMIVLSSISPNEAGEINVVGTVFYTSEKRFAKLKTTMTKYGVLMGEEKFIPETKDEISRWNAFETNMQKIQLEQKVKVNHKKCRFFGC